MRAAQILSLALVVFSGQSLPVPRRMELGRAETSIAVRKDSVQLGDKRMRDVNEPGNAWRGDEERPGGAWKRDEDEPGDKWKRGCGHSSKK